jgi:hypothetical protein
MLCAAALIGWARSWESIKTTAREVRSVRADFTQEKHMKILARPLVSKGKFIYRSPGSLRWEYLSPVRSVLLMHEGGVRRFVKGRRGFTEDAGARLEAMRIVVEQIAQWLHGDFDANPDFSAKLLPGKPSRIILTPREEGLASIIRHIELRLSARPGVIDSVIIEEGRDSRTVLRFTGARLNEAIADRTFREIE